MTPAEFVDGIEQYYGRYERDAVKAMVIVWAQESAHLNLAEVLVKVTDSYSTQYRTQPDRAALTKLVGPAPPRDGDWEDERGNVFVYRNGLRLGHRDGGRLIPDLTKVPQHKRKRLAGLASADPALYAAELTAATALIPAPEGETA